MASEAGLVAHSSESEDYLSSDSRGPRPSSSLRSLRRTAAVVVSVGISLAAVAGLFAFRPGSAGVPPRQEKEPRTQLWESALWPLQSNTDDTNREFMDSVMGLPGIPYSDAELEVLRHPPKETEAAPVTTPAPVPKIPERADPDSNDCFKEEELFAGFCYKNCSALTAEKYPIRSSPNTCCTAEPCIFPSHLSFAGPFICTGYAVDGKGLCPRAPGHCDSDEEMYEGMCFKPCATLTENIYPHRVGPMTCCKYEPPCFSFANLKSEGFAPCTGYDVGGEGHKCSHEPTTGTRQKPKQARAA